MRIKVQDNKGNDLCSFIVNGFAEDKIRGKHFRLSNFRNCSLSEIEKDQIGTFVFIQTEQDFTNQLKQIEDERNS